MSERFWKVGFLTLVAGFCAAPACAQDFSAGKTAAQLFASDCSACHKSPAGLAKGQSVGSLTSFLREHYTTKSESAAAIAAYLTTAGPGTARISPQAPITGAKPKNAEGEAKPETKPVPKPRQAAISAEPDKQPETEAAKQPVDPVVAKLNAYAAARGEPKDTARLTTPADKLESYASSGAGADAIATEEPKAKPKPADKKKKDTTGSTADAVNAAAVPHNPKPRRAQAPIIRPPPGNN